jgi:hypothetical protein
MKKNLLPVLVAMVTAAVVGGITVYRNSCNVVDPETFAVSPCLRTADYITYSVLALVIGAVLFVWVKKRTSA